MASSQSDPSPRPAWLSRLLNGRLLWLTFAAFVFYFLFRNISWAATWEILSQIRPLNLFWLVLLNGAFVASLMGSWWMVIRSLGDSVPYPAVIRYGLGGFAVSYFTPGPQFGGEPVQVLMLHRRHGVPIARAAAGVAVDKAINLVVNATVLIIGLIIGWLNYGGDRIELTSAVWLFLPLFFLPFLLLIAWTRGLTPLTRLATWTFKGLVDAAEALEKDVVRFCHDQPSAVWITLGIASLTWVILITEFWVMAATIGLTFTLVELITVVTAVRIAWLFPLPSAVGVLEAAQVGALTLIGVTDAAEFGLSLSLLIRLRDVLLGVVGFALIRTRPSKTGMIERETTETL